MKTNIKNLGSLIALIFLVGCGTIQESEIKSTEIIPRRTPFNLADVKSPAMISRSSEKEELINELIEAMNEAGNVSFIKN
tara:strand:- start:276 stop:515 length:240 start_codon:yes stop_codon:yes gene_type:complete